MTASEGMSEGTDPLWLIGMMGSGKSTIGEQAARAIGVPFFDTDQMVMTMSGMSIDRIWEEHGERGFRTLERRAVTEVPDSGCVVAAGGGVVLDPDNREILSDSNQVIWLKCSVSELVRRVSGSDRPLLVDSTEEAIKTILSDRSELYYDVSTHNMSTDRMSLERCVGRVVEIWNG